LTVYIDIEIVQGCKDGLGHFQDHCINQFNLKLKY